VTEARRASGEMYGLDRVLAIARRHLQESPSILVDSIRADVAAFTGGAPQRDDLTLLAVRFDG